MRLIYTSASGELLSANESERTRIDIFHLSFLIKVISKKIFKEESPVNREEAEAMSD
jgi:hypothetical protein